MLFEIDETPAPSPQAVAFAMVANEMSGVDRRGVRSERPAHWRHAGNVPIGRLGVPLDHYARCAQAMRAARAEKNIERFFAEAANYVHRAAEVSAARAMIDSTGFSSTQAILPAEPEAVAMTTAMSIMSHAMFGMPISKILEPGRASDGCWLRLAMRCEKQRSEGTQRKSWRSRLR